MSFVTAAPEYLSAAATDLADIGSVISGANTAAIATTSNVPPQALTRCRRPSRRFSAHGQAYQALSAEVTSFHQQFVQLLHGSAGQYAVAEAAAANPLQAVEQDILGVINTPASC